MEIRSTAEVEALNVEFADKYLNLMLEKRGMDENIKALKTEYQGEGVATGVIASAINKIKAKKKKTDSEIFEENEIIDQIESNTTCDDKIGQLVA